MTSIATSGSSVASLQPSAAGLVTFPRVLAALALAAVAAAITSNAWLDLVQISMVDEESSHVWLVPLVFVWLFWVRRHRLARCRPQGQWVGVACLAVGWFLWSFGYRYQYQSLWHGGAVVLVVGAALSILGRDLLLRFFPAFASLVFLIPVPGRARLHLAEPLQRATALATQSVAEVIGIPIERFGSLLTVNGQEVAIAEACNGMRMVFTLFLACYLFAFVTPLRTWVRVLIIVLTPLVAIICNIIRLVPTVWMYGQGSDEAASAFHDISGWVMLVLAFLMLKSSVEVLRWAGVPVEPEPETARGATP